MRDALIIFVAIIAAIVIGGYLFMNGGSAFNPERAPILTEPEPFTVLAEGQDSGEVQRRTNFRIMSDEELTALWPMVHPTHAPVTPQVDFSRYEVIAIFDGSHSSGGYAVRVTDVSDDRGVRTVYIERIVPGEDCVVTEAFTSPFQIIRVPKTTLPLTKQETLVTRDCS